MTALIRKDFYLLGKIPAIAFAAALGLSFIPRMEGIGTTYPMVLIMTLPLTTMVYDEQCHWDTYLSMTPCHPAKAVLSKYLFTLILAVSMLLLTFLADFVRCAITGADYDLSGCLVERVSLLAVIMAANAITFPVVFRFGVERGRLTMMALMFGVFAAIMGGAYFVGAENMFGWMDRVPLNMLAAAAAVVIIAVNIASFFLSVRFYWKRQSGAYN